LDDVPNFEGTFVEAHVEIRRQGFNQPQRRPQVSDSVGSDRLGRFGAVDENGCQRDNMVTGPNF
jgi:hypothetical protein